MSINESPMIVLQLLVDDRQTKLEVLSSIKVQLAFYVELFFVMLDYDIRLCSTTNLLSFERSVV